MPRSIEDISQDITTLQDKLRNSTLPLTRSQGQAKVNALYDEWKALLQQQAQSPKNALQGQKAVISAEKFKELESQLQATFTSVNKLSASFFKFLWNCFSESKSFRRLNNLTRYSSQPIIGSVYHFVGNISLLGTFNEKKWDEDLARAQSVEDFEDLYASLEAWRAFSSPAPVLENQDYYGE